MREYEGFALKLAGVELSEVWERWKVVARIGDVIGVDGDDDNAGMLCEELLSVLRWDRACPCNRRVRPRANKQKNVNLSMKKMIVKREKGKEEREVT